MSTHTQNLSKLRELRLNAMATAYELQQEQAKLQHLAFDDRFGLLLESEVSTRNSRKLNRLVKSADFPEIAAFEDYDARASRGLDKALMSTLANCSWITRKQNLMILGPTGVGKTWLASAFGHQACRLGMTVAFYVANDLFTSIGQAVLDASLPKLKMALYKPNLLILDDFGIGETRARVAAWPSPQSARPPGRHGLGDRGSRTQLASRGTLPAGIAPPEPPAPGYGCARRSMPGRDGPRRRRPW